MSASERLRALYIPDMGEFDFRVDEVRDALPLIADVVEAAEAFVALPDTTVADAGPALMERLTKTYAALPAALTALQEHLEGGDGA